MVSSHFARLCAVDDRDRVASVSGLLVGEVYPLLASMKFARIVLFGVPVFSDPRVMIIQKYAIESAGSYFRDPQVLMVSDGGSPS